MKKFKYINICSENVDIHKVLDYLVDNYNYSYIQNNYDETLVVAPIYNCIGAIELGVINLYIGDNISNAYEYIFDIYIDSYNLTDMELSLAIHNDISNYK